MKIIPHIHSEHICTEKHDKYRHVVLKCATAQKHVQDRSTSPKSVTWF